MNSLESTRSENQVPMPVRRFFKHVVNAYQNQSDNEKEIFHRDMFHNDINSKKVISDNQRVSTQSSSPQSSSLQSLSSSPSSTNEPYISEFKNLLSKLESIQDEITDVSVKENKQFSETEDLMKKVNSDEEILLEIKEKEKQIDAKVTEDHVLLEAAIGKLENLSDKILDLQINSKDQNRKELQIEEEIAESKEAALIHDREQDVIHAELVEKDKLILRLQEIIAIEEKLHDLEEIYNSHYESADYSIEDLGRIKDRIFLLKRAIFKLKKTI